MGHAAYFAQLQGMKMTPRLKKRYLANKQIETKILAQKAGREAERSILMSKSWVEEGGQERRV